jgi:NTE family protein
MSAALILIGGGARAAYQIVILRAVAELLPRDIRNPFPIVCGTSAGAINALSIAGHPGTFRARVASLVRVWRTLRAQDVYRTDFFGVARNSVGLATSLMRGGCPVDRPLALLNNAPLRSLLERHVDFRHIDAAIASGELDAVCVTALHYGSGRSVSFFQGRQANWERNRRCGQQAGLGIDHLMASTAIPLLFPATRVDGGFYGDGALRQLKPLSPALHLGARRLFVVGVSDNPRHWAAALAAQRRPPSVGHILGQLLNSAFIDAIESDLETMTTINALAAEIPATPHPLPAIAHLAPIQALCISPSEPIDRIAEQHYRELPLSVRLFLRTIGATTRSSGASAASYLLFEPGFCRKLLDLGYRDARDCGDRIRAFFDLPEAAEAPGPIPAGTP